jgi:hypothetical protein
LRCVKKSSSIGRNMISKLPLANASLECVFPADFQYPARFKTCATGYIS